MAKALDNTNDSRKHKRLVCKSKLLHHLGVVVVVGVGGVKAVSGGNSTGEVSGRVEERERVKKKKEKRREKLGPLS